MIGRSFLRPLTWEALLCVCFLVCLIGLGRSVYAAAGDASARGDLSLDVLARESREVLRPATPAENSAGTALTHDDLSDGKVTDTIGVGDLATRTPSVRRGGFLGEVIAGYNRRARRAEWLGRLTSAPSAPETQALFLTTGPVVDAKGHRHLVIDPSALTVPSPFAERAWRTVLAHDSRLFKALLRADGTLEPRPPERLDRPDVRPPGWCTAVQRPGDLITDIYCGSLVGLEPGLNYEVRYFADARGFNRVLPGRSKPIWINGHRLEQSGRDSLTPIRPGEMIYARRTSAMIPSLAATGLIAGSSVVNGQRRFFVTQGPIRSLAIALARNNPVAGTADTTVLALHSGITRSFDSATQAFLMRYGDVERVEAIIIDGRNGEVRSLVGRTYLGQLGYLPGFEPGYVGSLVKPILATAILSRQPRLAGLRVQSPATDIWEIRGLHVTPFAPGPSGAIDLVEFLRRSSNHFAAELLFASLEKEEGERIDLDPAGDVPLSTLESSAVASGLLEVFEVQAGGDKSGERDDRLWRDPRGGGGILPAVRNQPWFWPWSPRPSLFVMRALSTKATDSLRGASPTMLSRFAYGQGYHEWTLLGAAQAFARIVTGRRISSRMLEGQGIDSAPAFAWRKDPWAVQIREGLHLVVVDGTGRGLQADFSRSFGSRKVTVFGKTGSALLDDEDGRADRQTLGLFVTAGDPQQRPPECGIAIALATDYKNGRPRDLLAHLAFAREVVAPLLARYWDEITSCRP